MCVASVGMLAARRVLQAVLVIRACLGTGDQRVASLVVQGAMGMCVTLMKAVARAEQATMEAVVIKSVLQSVLITHAPLLMVRVSVVKDIMVNVVKIRA